MCTWHVPRWYAGYTSSSMQADLSYEIRTQRTWSCLHTCTPSCAPDGDRLKDGKDNTSKEHTASGVKLVLQPHLWGTWEKRWWAVRPQVGCLVLQSQSWLVSATDRNHPFTSPMTYHQHICSAFSLKLPHAKCPNLDIWSIFYQLKERVLGPLSCICTALKTSTGLCCL